ncbi:hypothetical protein [Paenibacillus sp. UMB4589-SE434]|nr:hypothetical protein [Paenibacillus sp. UMB4589-SE434]MDK8183371.1 hypothetical protein [Paenibacillus sp. UMB4589-SE434]
MVDQAIEEPNIVTSKPKTTTRTSYGIKVAQGLTMKSNEEVQ